MLVYLENLSNEAATDVLVPRIQSLLSPTGKVRLLSLSEVQTQKDCDMNYKQRMRAKEDAVGGNLGGVQSLLMQAMSYGGKVEEEGPCKKQKTMGAQALECLWTAQTVAKSGVRVKAMQGVDEK